MVSEKKPKVENSPEFRNKCARITAKGNLECFVMTVLLVVLIKRQ